jgi:hypothetical protein
LSLEVHLDNIARPHLKKVERKKDREEEEEELNNKS